MKIKVMKLSLVLALSIGTLTPILAAHAQTDFSSKELNEAGKPRKSEWRAANPMDESRALSDGRGEITAADAHPPSAVPTSETKRIKPSAEKDTGDSNRIIVKYKEGANTTSLLGKLALSEVSKISKLGMEVVEAPEGTQISQMISQLENDPNVLYAEPDVKVHAASYVPNDPEFSNQWNLLNTGQNGGTPGIDMELPAAWNMTKGSSDLIVAVIDTGVDINHPDLKDNIWTNPNETVDGKDDDGNGFPDDIHGWDFYHNDNSVYDTIDGDVHGTQVAGIIAASLDNGIGISGVAPKVKVMPLKFMGPDGDGYISNAIEAIEYAEYMGARIANLSWTTFDYSQALKDAIDSSSMLFVAASGDNTYNGNPPDNDIEPAYPASYDSDNILSVATVDNKGETSWGSFRYGLKSVDVAAPGEEVFTTSPSDQIGVGAQIETPTYKALFHMGIQDIVGLQDDYPDADVIEARTKASQLAAFTSSMDFFKLNKETARILLVQDDQSDRPEIGQAYNYLNFYKGLLDQTGYAHAYDTFTINSLDEHQYPAVNNGPTIQKLQQYDLVLWFTGVGFGFASDLVRFPVLGEEEQINLTDYLNHGGNLFMTGEYTFLGIEDSYFVQQTLHLNVVRNRAYSDIWYELSGIPGTIYEGQKTLMKMDDNAQVIAANDSNAKINLEVPIAGYGYAYGSSMAAANATGVAALILSQNPVESNELVKERMMVSGVPLASLQGYIASGSMVNARRALADYNLPGMPLRGSNTQSGTLDSEGTVESEVKSDKVYYIHLLPGQKLDVDMTGDAGTDFDLYLYHPSATTVFGREGIVAKSEKEGVSTESISYVANEEGYYSIDVFAYSGKGGFALTLSTGNGVGRYEDTHPSLAYQGPWSSVTNSGFSGGTAKQLNDIGNVQFQFTGSEIEWIGFKDSNQGEANVYLDGVKEKGTVTLTSDSLLTSQSLYQKSLPYGSHSIKIEWVESNRQPKDGKELGNRYINVDAFVVLGEAPVSVPADPTILTFEEGNSFIQYKGAWKVNVSPTYSGGTEKYSDIKDNYLQFNFTGSGIELVASTGPTRGKANIYVDGKLVSTIDYYSKAFRNKAAVFKTSNLAKENHTIKVVNIGEKNEHSSGTVISIDAFKVARSK